MKDDELKEAMDELEKEAKEFCKERGLDLKKAKFTLQGSQNLFIQQEYFKIQGIASLIQKSKNMIKDIGFGEHEALVFIIDGWAADSLWMMNSDYYKDLEMTTLEAHAHVRISILNRYRVKFFF